MTQSGSRRRHVPSSSNAPDYRRDHDQKYRDKSKGRTRRDGPRIRKAGEERPFDPRRFDKDEDEE